MPKFQNSQALEHWVKPLAKHIPNCLHPLAVKIWDIKLYNHIIVIHHNSFSKMIFMSYPANFLLAPTIYLQFFDSYNFIFIVAPCINFMFQVPQMILLTFDDAINFENWDLYTQQLFISSRKNANGCPIRGTFYVSHQYTNYQQTQKLWNDGHEIAVHSIT